MLSLALLMRIAVPPVLVALMSLAARRWGPTIGGLIMGLPWMTGPVLFFFAYDKGADFAVAACTGIEIAVVGIAGYVLAFGLLARYAPWPVCLIGAMTTYFLIGYSSQVLELTLWQAALIGVAALIVTYLLLPKPRTATFPGRLPWWDIPARMAATFCLVAIIMTTADRLGPRLSGIVSSFPVILTVIGSFTLSQWGADALLRVLRGMTLSLMAFAGFFVVIGYALPVFGLVQSFALAAVAAVSISGIFIVWNNAMQARASRNGPSG